MGTAANYLPLDLEENSGQWGIPPGLMPEDVALLALKMYAQWTAKVVLDGQPQVVTLDPGDIIGVPAVHNPPGSSACVRCHDLAYVVSPKSSLYPQSRTVYGARGTAGVIMLGPLPDFQLLSGVYQKPLEQAFWKE